ncbi:hypothetical protein [Rhodoplanes azumiensis]|uniref:Uncharacterized protein n=1 Tax=Rhodoplanes azumiensis TaxID=1897628 RepID=A0ABW5AHC9_9BRAD
MFRSTVLAAADSAAGNLDRVWTTSPSSFERPAPNRSPIVPSDRSKRKGQPQRPSPEPSAETVLRAFNTWAFKREQPENPHLLMQVVATAVGRAEPLRFVMYWGKGPRCSIGVEDIECLDYLGSMMARVRDAHRPGVAVTLILTDTHARHNGHPEESIDTYFAAIADEATRRGFQTCRLSRVVADAGVAAVPADLDAPVAADVLDSLAASAGKWYRGAGSAEDGALAYYRMNMVEKRAVELAFPGAIFVTFNGSKLRCLFPARMPIFYMYSLRRGFSVKPWFLPADQELCGPKGCRCRGGETLPD